MIPCFHDPDDLSVDTDGIPWRVRDHRNPAQLELRAICVWFQVGGGIKKKQTVRSVIYNYIFSPESIIVSLEFQAINVTYYRLPAR